MTEKQAKQYEDDCKKSGNLDYPLAGSIKCPLCKICKNYVPRDKNWNPPQCLAIKTDIPDEYLACWSYDCQFFIHNKDSIFNREFDENHKPLRK